MLVPPGGSSCQARDVDFVIVGRNSVAGAALADPPPSLLPEEKGAKQSGYSLRFPAWRKLPAMFGRLPRLLPLMLHDGYRESPGGSVVGTGTPTCVGIRGIFIYLSIYVFIHLQPVSAALWRYRGGYVTSSSYKNCVAV
jgi:hypothetical protein